MSSWAKTCNNKLRGLKPALVMVLVESVFALVNILYKLATNTGMSASLLIMYRFMFGAAFITPVAFFAERKKRPKWTWKIVSYGFLCGLFGGSLGQNLYLRSLVLTSATFSSAMTNLVPAITFIIAITLRLERLEWNTTAGKAKVFGTILGIGGAMLLTFYRGPIINVWDTHVNLMEITSMHDHRPVSELPSYHHNSNRFIIGAFLALSSCIFYSLWLIIQAKAAERFPCPYSLTAMMTLFASFQGLVIAMCFERDFSKWRLGWDIRLFTVAVAGVLGSGLMFAWVAWCVKMRGPLFVSSFQPLMLLMVAICGALFLEEKLHLGIVIGAVLIVIGLYAVLWGKGRELKKAPRSMPEADGVESRLPEVNASPPQGGGKVVAEGQEEDEERDSRASSEILSSIHVYP